LLKERLDERFEDRPEDFPEERLLPADAVSETKTKLKVMHAKRVAENFIVSFLIGLIEC
tara:strand:+ start:281481 stop:281657 length:177 start_codon:yes stop_codon:yes gene_type:complete